MGRLELVLGLQDIRTFQKDRGGEAGIDGGHGGKAGQIGRELIVGKRLPDTDQQIQGVAILGHQTDIAGDIHPGGIHLAPGTVEIQFGPQPHFLTPSDQIISRLLILKGRPGQPEILLIGGQGHIRPGNRRYQQDPGTAVGLRGGQVRLQGLVLETAQAPEEIDLPGKDPQVHVVLFRRVALSGGGQVGRNPFLVPLAERSTAG